MKQLFFVLLVASAFWGCQSGSGEPVLQIQSPENVLQLAFALDTQGRATYTLQRGDAVVIPPSGLGMEFQSGGVLKNGLTIVNTVVSEKDETWEMPWGEQRTVRNHYRELKVNLREIHVPTRIFAVVFRLYDDGLGFRYEFPDQSVLADAVILNELTEFNLAGDPTCWWIPGDWDIYEHLYNETKFSEIDAISKRDHPNLAQTYIPENAVNTPVTLKTTQGLYLSFHEANLVDYADMTLRVNKKDKRFESALVGRADGVKVQQKAPFHTPWRTIQVADRAGALIESRLIENLNEPNKIGDDLAWIQPMKYAGIWWEMHLGKSTWEMASGKHGATTANAKAYIDFCAANNIKGLLVEGWNTGWEHWIGFDDREGVFDFVTPYPDYDLPEVVRYAKEKGVNIIMHHETSAAPRTYDQQLDTAYQLMQDLGIHAVKTGYVGPIIPKGEYHHGQWMVNHYNKVMETAAAHQVMLDVHEPIKPTGLRRTYPNLVAAEGLRGQEFNAWSAEGGNPTNHLSVVAFTRMLAGPIDYTPGIFNLSLNPYKPDNRVKHTLAHELALYVVIYSPIQMMSDLPEYATGQPGMQWVRDVAVNWEKTVVLNGEPGDFVTIARQERGGNRWFLGSITNEEARTLSLDTDFLTPGQTYRVVAYQDAADAHWDTNPTALTIEEKEVRAGEKLTLNLAAGGGAALMLVPK